MTIMTLELTVAPFAFQRGGQVHRYQGLALFVDTRPAIYLLREDGSRERVCSRHLVEPEVWIGLGGTRLEPPRLIGDDLVVHCGAQTLRDESPLGFSVLDGTLCLGGDREAVCLHYGLWRAGSPDRHHGVEEIMIAPARFALEDVAFLGSKGRKRRDRLSPLAG